MNAQQLYLALRKRARKAIHGRHFVIKRQGKRYLIDIHSYIDRQVEAFGGYEQKLVNNFVSISKNAGANIFLDIGANVGIYTIEFAKNFDNLEIHAFEPDKRNFSQLMANVYLNEIYDRGLFHNFGVSATKATLSFDRYTNENPGRSRVDDDGKHKILAFAIDDIIDVAGRTIAIKIDVEGHEVPALNGMRRTLIDNSCIIQVETFDRRKVSAFFDDIGYILTNDFGTDLIFMHPDRQTSHKISW